MGYKDLLPIGTSLILCATSFLMGVIYSNLPYDYRTLYNTKLATDVAFEQSLQHYKNWGESSLYVIHGLHFVVLIGFIGCFIKIFKPSDEAKNFEYGTLGAYTLAVVIYLTNVRTGILSAVHDIWGDVDQHTGLNIIGASQAMIVFVLGGVLVLQGGLYYAEWENERMLVKYYEEESEREEKEREEAVIEVGELKDEIKHEHEQDAEASGVSTTSTGGAKKTAKKSKKKV